MEYAGQERHFVIFCGGQFVMYLACQQVLKSISTDETDSAGCSLTWRKDVGRPDGGCETSVKVAFEGVAAEQEGGALESSLKKSAGIIQSAALGPSPNFENAEGVERDVLAHEERARPSIRNLWDVKDAKTLLADYINNITAHLEKHGASPPRSQTLGPV